MKFNSLTVLSSSRNTHHDSIIELTDDDLMQVNGGNACTTAFELSYGVIAGSLGGIFGPAGAVAGFGAGYSFGSMLAEGICDAR